MDTDYVVNGSSKCFAHWASSSSHAILDSFNTASMTDPGTGIGNANFTNNMSNANFAISASTESMNEAVNWSNVSTSAVNVTTYNSSHAAADNAHTTATIHGDLA